MKTAILTALLLGLLAVALPATASPPLYPGDPGGICVGGYNEQAYANVCKTNLGPSNFLVPVYVLPVQSGSFCPVGGVCVPLYSFEIVYGAPIGQPPLGLYVEAVCNQPTLPCGCTAPYLVEVCAPFIQPE